MIRFLVRMLLVVTSCVCVTLVLGELVFLIMLWQGGSLSEGNVREIRLVLGGSATAPASPATAATEARVAEVNLEDVERTRAMRILGLEARESTLNLIEKNLIDRNRRIELLQATLKSEQAAFKTELARLSEEFQSQGTEQARLVLQALPPAEAASRLQPLSIDDSILLLRGLPEKTIAKILKEMTGTPEKIERGQKLFEALRRGDPERTLVNETQAQQQG